MADKKIKLTLHGETEIEEGYQYVVETDDIEDVAILSDDRYLKISGLPATRESVELINELLADVSDVDEAKEVLEAHGYTTEECGDFVPAASGDYDALIWCREGASLLSDCEPVPSYTWWDGSNWRREWLNLEDMTDVVVDAVYEDLDTYSSNGDKRFRRQWEHGKLYTVLTIDDEPVTEPTYLLYISSQWQGVRDVARLIDADEREMLLAETSGELYTVAQAAEALDISQQRVRALCAEGRCGCKVGRDWVLTAADIEALRDRPGPGRPSRWATMDLDAIDRVTLTEQGAEILAERIPWRDLADELAAGMTITYRTIQYAGGQSGAILVVHRDSEGRPCDRAAICLGGNSEWGDWDDRTYTLRLDEGDEDGPVVYGLDGRRVRS